MTAWDNCHKDWILSILAELVGYAEIISNISNIPLKDVWLKLLNYKNIASPSTPQRNKVAVITHYSNGTMKCRHCGNGDMRVLSIDHMNGDGAAHRKTIKGLYSWLIEKHYPTGFQVLCMNCQWVKRAENHEQYTNATS